ncbi:MAG TPA: archease [Candidatus Anoxymicrobiaceae bacterium]
MRFRTIEHTADIGIEVEADSLAELFRGAAQAMFSIMVEPGGVEQSIDRTVRLEASDVEELMFRWLNELIFFVSGERLLLSGFDVLSMSDRALEAVVRGEPIDPAKHELELEIKAATYHELEVRGRDGCWFARAIFDV